MVPAGGGEGEEIHSPQGSGVVGPSQGRWCSDREKRGIMSGSLLSQRSVMTEAVEQWKTLLGALAQQERAELAHFLLLSLEPEEQGAEAA